MNLNIGISQLQLSTSPQRYKAEEGDRIQNSSISTENLSPQKWSLNNGNNSPRHQTLALGEYLRLTKAFILIL
jgi:hypothetical protein